MGMSARPRKPVDDSSYAGRFALRLRMLREQNDLTVDQLAKLSGVPKRTIFRWESLERSPINEDLNKIAKSLGISIRSLLPEE